MSQITTTEQEESEGIQQMLTRLPESLHRKFKIQCAQNDKSMQDVVVSAIRQYVANGEPQ